jgi:hypothetical protein
MRKLTIALAMAIIVSSVTFSAEQYTAQDKIEAEVAFDCFSMTIDSWSDSRFDNEGETKVENSFLKLDKLIGSKGVNFVLITPEIKTVNRKKVCVTTTTPHRISADTFHKNIMRQYEIVKADTLLLPLKDSESVLLRKYILNYAIGYPINEGDGSVYIDLPHRKSIGEWSWTPRYYIPDGTPTPNPYPFQKIRFIKSNSGVWQVDEIQIFLITNIRKEIEPI